MQTEPIVSHESSVRPSLDLDDLAAKSYDDLDRLYRAGRAPASLAEVDGKLVGRMLRVVRLDRGRLGEALRRFAASRSFVWGGKTFEATGPDAGRGHNRIQLAGVLGRQNLFPFETRFDASALDGKRTIVLDYDLADNPGYIRKIHDEIREVSRGVFLGPAMWKTAAGPKTLLWFALSTGRS